MYQFFVEEGQICGDRIVITGEDVNHIKNVLRMKIGEEIAVSNGVDGREYRCEVAQLLADEVVCKLRFIKENDVELPAQVYLFQGLPKADKMELIIQKAVELGAYSVIPVATRRSIVKLDDKKAAAKQNRWQGIAEAAAKQSKRKIIPKIETVMSFAEALEMAKELEVRLIPYELAEDMSHTKEIIERIREGQKIAIFIGPEGGFDETEIAMASEVGVEPITLGKRILRTETAGMTVLAWLMYHLEK